jgi:RNA polymerase sigma factor (TIGR02999 family)
VLIDQARRKACSKRGANQTPEEFHESAVASPTSTEEMLAVHEALDALAVEDPTAAEVVKLRYFVGLTIPEIADILEISPRSAERHWCFARAWLKGAIRS